MGIPRSSTVLTKQERIAMLAKQSPEMCFTSLNHHIDLDWLREAFRQTRKDGAVGIDDQTWAGYEVGLDANLASLLTRAKSGSYFAPPVRRAYIPKGNGETRPIGIPCLEDKVLQRAVVMLLEPIYEQDFLDCSYGFRPKRSQHMAISALWNQISSTGGGWVLEIDIRKFFDTLDKAKLRELIEQRVGDGVIKRLIGKWLNAGVMESGSVTFSESGSPQGGVISPLASNVYLHYVLDQWFETEVKPILRGRASMVRFADDAVLVFTNETDARSVMAALHKRFGKYGLSLHPDKTRITSFCRPREHHEEPETFDFLGFTHYWGESHQGRLVLKRKTAKDRQARAIKKISEWCREHRHFSLPEQHKELSSKLRGHYQYYGVTGNMRCLQNFRSIASRTWRKWLSRRSQRACMPWSKFNLLLKRYSLPKAWLPHSVFIT